MKHLAGAETRTSTPDPTWMDSRTPASFKRPTLSKDKQRCRREKRKDRYNLERLSMSNSCDKKPEPEQQAVSITGAVIPMPFILTPVSDTSTPIELTTFHAVLLKSKKMGQLEGYFEKQGMVMNDKMKQNFINENSSTKSLSQKPD